MCLTYSRWEECMTYPALSFLKQQTRWVAWLPYAQPPHAQPPKTQKDSTVASFSLGDLPFVTTPGPFLSALGLEQMASGYLPSTGSYLVLYTQHHSAVPQTPASPGHFVRILFHSPHRVRERSPHANENGWSIPPCQHSVVTWSPHMIFLVSVSPCIPAALTFVPRPVLQLSL